MEDDETQIDLEALEAHWEQTDRTGVYVMLLVIGAAVAAMLALYLAPQWPAPVAVFTLLGVILAALLLGEW